MSAPLRSASMRGPGVFGLNTENAQTVDDHRWLVEGRNLVFDEFGRMAARKGLNPLTTTGDHSDDVESIHEFIEDAASSEIISAAGNVLYTGTVTLTDITGAITTPTADDWQFVNFNGKCIGVQQAHTPIVYTGTGNFADLVAGSGSLPTGNAALSAFGRLWVAGLDKTTMQFSAVLDETDWGGAGAGSLDTLEVWPDGIDTITAIAEFQNQLLIFGTRSVLVYTGAEDPTAATFVLNDIIDIGSHFRDSLVTIGHDLVFMADDGLRSISRGIESSTMPLTDLTGPVKTTLSEQLQSAVTVRSAFSPFDKAILTRVSSGTGTFYWYFDLGQRLPSGDMRSFQWDGIGYTTVAVSSDDTVYLGMNGKIADHSTFNDITASYTISWLTAGTTLGVDQLKILKRLRLLIGCFTDTNVTLRWVTDFGSKTYATTVPVNCDTNPDEWNLGEWGLAEWSGNARALQFISTPMTNAGWYFQIGAMTTIDGGKFLFSDAVVLTKAGRLAA